MQLASLRVAHQLKNKSRAVPPLQNQPGFYLETCQRLLWIYSENHLNEANYEFSKDPNAVGDHFSGSEAYAFLLKISCGLESQVPGETEIFNQIKEGWLKFQSNTAPASELSPWMQKLFEDTKEIRSQNLQNLGGVSYGSLVRKFIRKHSNSTHTNTSAVSPILLVGAGKLAWSVAPWLLDHELWIWNRSPKHAELLRDSLLAKNKATVRVIQGKNEEWDAWKNAIHAVVCIPLDPTEDRARIQAWKDGYTHRDKGCLFHLGTEQAQANEWNLIPRFQALDDLYALQKSQEKSRAELLARAREACDEKSFLRSFIGTQSTPLTFSHGWEDLPVWA